MPVYEVTRRTVCATAVVEARNETHARCLARDVWQQDAAIAALGADVLRQPNLDPMDAYLDEQDAERVHGPDDRPREEAARMGLAARLSDSEGLEPW